MAQLLSVQFVFYLFREIDNRKQNFSFVNSVSNRQQRKNKRIRIKKNSLQKFFIQCKIVNFDSFGI